MALVLTATQQCELSIEVVDAKGNPAKVDGVPEWSSAEEAYVTVEASSDGMSAVAKAVGPVTSTPVQVNVTVDAELDDEVREIVGVLEISVVAGEAVSIGISAGEPEEQA